jgi:Fic family protein
MQAPPPPLLQAEELEFLHQSNAIEGIESLDYKRSRAGLLQGHVAAYLHSQRLARAQRPLSAVDLCWWQQLIVFEQRQAKVQTPAAGVGRFRSGFAPFNVGVGDYVPPSFSRVPELMQAWLRDLRAQLMGEPPRNETVLADACGDLLQRFEAIHPFVDGNGRVGRLVVNYMLSYWGRRIVVFTLAERDRFYAAHRSKAHMREFMRTKLGVLESA